MAKSLEPKHKSSLRYFTPAIGWGIFVLYMSLTPGDELPKLILEVNDKLIHAGIYFFSALLIYLALIRYNVERKPSRRQLLFILAICIVFGGAIELAQHNLVRNRNGDWYDFIANTVGAVCSVLLMRILHRMISLRR